MSELTFTITVTGNERYNILKARFEHQVKEFQRSVMDFISIPTTATLHTVLDFGQAVLDAREAMRESP